MLPRRGGGGCKARPPRPNKHNTQHSILRPLVFYGPAFFSFPGAPLNLTGRTTLFLLVSLAHSTGQAAFKGFEGFKGFNCSAAIRCQKEQCKNGTRANRPTHFFREKIKT